MKHYKRIKIRRRCRRATQALRRSRMDWKVVEIQTLKLGDEFYMGQTRYEVSCLPQDPVVTWEGVDEVAGKYYDFHPNTAVRVKV